MIVAVDATTLGSGAGGDETLMLSMLRGLAVAAEPEDRVLALAERDAKLPADLVDAPGIAIERVRRRGGATHYTYALPNWLNGLRARGTKPDVVLSLTHAPLRAPAPVALVVTDLSFRHVPDAYPRSTRTRLNTLVPRQAPRAAAVLTISEFCRRDLLASYDLEPDRVHVVPLTIDAPAPAEPAAIAALAARGVRAPYLLYLGNLHPRKNVPLAIRAFRAVRSRSPRLRDHQFVVAGATWFGSDAEHEAAAGAAPGEIVFLNRVDTAEREALLQQASGLAYLSSFEGFGLPPIEAMARDTPVIAADTSAIPETCGGAALLVDPTDEAGVEAALARLLEDLDLRAELQDRGRRRVADFDVASTGTALWQALRAAAGPTGPTSTEPHHIGQASTR